MTLAEVALAWRQQRAEQSAGTSDEAYSQAHRALSGATPPPTLDGDRVLASLREALGRVPR